MLSQGGPGGGGSDNDAVLSVCNLAELRQACGVDQDLSDDAHVSSGRTSPRQKRQCLDLMQRGDGLYIVNAALDLLFNAQLRVANNNASLVILVFELQQLL